MNTQLHKSNTTGRKSLLYRDLASPVCQKGKFSTPGQAAAVSALWKENFGGGDPPPPPVFTLDDRADFSPEAGVRELPMSLDSRLDKGPPSFDSATPLKGKLSFGVADSTPSHGLSASPTLGSSNWWTRGKGVAANGEEESKGSPVDGMVLLPETSSGGLLMLPPPREVARSEVQKNNVSAGNSDEEQWVTVYGFSPGDTNLVLREFEKCGVILRHVPGPHDANWIHILYQSHFDAQKALAKNGVQINGLIIVGVKPLDPALRHSLDTNLGNQGVLVSVPATSAGSFAVHSVKSSPTPYYSQASENNFQSGGAVALPSKSMLSKVMDLMLGT